MLIFLNAYLDAMIGVDLVNNIFDKRTLRKITILYYIVNNQSKSNLNDISNYLECNIRTTKSLINELSSEIKDWNSQAYLKLKIDQQSNSIDLFIPSLVSIHEMYLYYLERNITFNALKTLFFDNSFELNKYAINNYVSYTTMYKNMKLVSEKVLSRYELEFHANVKSNIVGSEVQKRLFYFEFFWYSYSGIKWPFETIKKESFDFLFSYIEKIRKQSIGLSEKEILRHYFAIIFYRIENNEICDKSILENDLLIDSKHFDLIKKDTIPAYQNMFPKLTNEEVESEVAFLYLTVFGLEYHVEDNSIVSEMMFYVQTHQVNVVEYTNLWMTEFLLSFDVNLNAKEYSLLYANLIHVHSRILLYKGIESITEDIPEMSKPIKSEIINFYNQLVKKMNYNESFVKNEKYLINKYQLLISRHIRNKSLNNPVNVCILSIYGGEVIKDFIDLLKNNNLDEMVNVTISLDEIVDVIITDRIYDSIKDSNVETLLWEVYPTQKSKMTIINFLKNLILKKNT
ncbi:hypothetical protein CKN82_03425 [Carnobacterium divergens]|nr:hypothetical protein CKN70_03285 [Carnobacterium divergens]TFI83793.1 hypothetical protein CKN68_03440 [Carnobacterium divergens]TFI91844.1 hypothetical protein CKN72_03350 [Carnobacterium divergens]TFI99792.1 hypothetical protein CKN67_03440 [Carnobacterium divergens]TFJ00347.1 hypothetical protein CKN82_03425 [Carnobacterium divergens]